MNRATARRYAKALFELAQQEKQLGPVRERLDQIDQMIQSQSELLNLCRNPIYSLDEKKRTLNTLASKIGSPALLIRFIELLIQKNRLRHLTEIAKVFSELVDEAEGRRQVRVRVAKELSSKQTEALRHQLEAILRRNVDLRVEPDPSLIGGMVVYAGSRVYDGSVKGQMQELRRELMK